MGPGHLALQPTESISALACRRSSSLLLSAWRRVMTAGSSSRSLESVLPSWLPTCV